MVKRGVLFCITLILIGTLDWFTTVVGVLFFGATETNLLLANLTQSNMILFSGLKLSAITVTGLIFYVAEKKSKITSKTSPCAKKFLNTGYVITLLTLTVVVLNNFNEIVKVS